MGNDCPACQSPITECNMRQIFSKQPRNRDDLDLSHIKQGNYKKSVNNKKQNQVQEPIIKNIVQSKIIQEKQTIIVKQLNRQPVLQKSLINQIDNPLSLDVKNSNLVIKSNVNYSGGSVNGKPHDKGTVTWLDGTILSGIFFFGQLSDNDKVKFFMKNGLKYEGDVRDGRVNGKGKVVFPDGSYYEGSWKNQLPEGQGKQVFIDGSVYEGAFKNGVKQGKGKYNFDLGVYEGMFKQDSFHGRGVLKTKNDTIISGQWVNGILEGQGKIQWQTGEKYIGQFVSNKRQGKGTYSYADGREWSGDWKNDLQNGFGTYSSQGQIIKSIWVGGIKRQQMRQIQINQNQ